MKAWHDDPWKLESLFTMGSLTAGLPDVPDFKGQSHINFVPRPVWPSPGRRFAPYFKLSVKIV